MDKVTRQVGVTFAVATTISFAGIGLVNPTTGRLRDLLGDVLTVDSAILTLSAVGLSLIRQIGSKAAQRAALFAAVFGVGSLLFAISARFAIGGLAIDVSSCIALELAASVSIGLLSSGLIIGGIAFGDFIREGGDK
jgi:hypothetical protein